eukprot:TRINITY_DN67806_c4_g9_i1.p1 TRINITY_DN67806_c4_g9~~TRINITY_DN67806_c4_g9_i1.p1  ORF type:complete len:611 (+),score=46.38 TRINITY_DN67806_c4_g9_i1:22-1854(+)
MGTTISLPADVLAHCSTYLPILHHWLKLRRLSRWTNAFIEEDLLSRPISLHLTHPQHFNFLKDSGLKHLTAPKLAEIVIDQRVTKISGIALASFVERCAKANGGEHTLKKLVCGIQFTDNDLRTILQNSSNTITTLVLPRPHTNSPWEEILNIDCKNLQRVQVGHHPTPTTKVSQVVSDHPTLTHLGLGMIAADLVMPVVLLSSQTADEWNTTLVHLDFCTHSSSFELSDIETILQQLVNLEYLGISANITIPPDAEPYKWGEIISDVEPEDPSSAETGEKKETQGAQLKLKELHCHSKIGGGFVSYVVSVAPKLHTLSLIADEDMRDLGTVKSGFGSSLRHIFCEQYSLCLVAQMAISFPQLETLQICKFKGDKAPATMLESTFVRIASSLINLKSLAINGEITDTVMQHLHWDTLTSLKVLSWSLMDDDDVSTDSTSQGATPRSTPTTAEPEKSSQSPSPSFENLSQPVEPSGGITPSSSLSTSWARAIGRNAALQELVVANCVNMKDKHIMPLLGSSLRRLYLGGASLISDTLLYHLSLECGLLEELILEDLRGGVTENGLYKVLTNCKSLHKLVLEKTSTLPDPLPFAHLFPQVRIQSWRDRPSAW